MSFHSVSRISSQIFRSFLALVFVCLAGAVAFARDGDEVENTPPVTLTDQQLVERVISGQLQAFQNGDLEQALSYADLPIVAMFQSPERFGEMVEQGYEPIFNNASHDFVQFNQLGAQAVQVITVESATGTKAIAQYRLSKASGNWRISGVMMQVLGGPSSQT